MRLGIGKEGSGESSKGKPSWWLAGCDARVGVTLAYAAGYDESADVCGRDKVNRRSAGVVLRSLVHHLLTVAGGGSEGGQEGVGSLRRRRHGLHTSLRQVCLVGSLDTYIDDRNGSSLGVFKQPPSTSPVWASVVAECPIASDLAPARRHPIARLLWSDYGTLWKPQLLPISVTACNRLLSSRDHAVRYTFLAPPFLHNRTFQHHVSSSHWSKCVST
ncbi:hypothetical protein MRX96_028358 [Rhipicephalus microplus]